MNCDCNNVMPLHTVHIPSKERKRKQKAPLYTPIIVPEKERIFK